MSDITYCIVTDDGSNCEDKHIACLATKDQEADEGLVQVIEEDGTIGFDYAPDWTPECGMWLVDKDPPGWVYDESKKEWVKEANSE